MQNNQYPSGLASLFSIQARQQPINQITYEQVSQAFQKAWDCKDDEKFLALYREYQVLADQYKNQQVGQNG
jgi:hypothetical protein